MSTGKVLVIGSGGREHAICWKLAQSPKVSQVYALPGSIGIAALDKCDNLKDVDAKDFEAIADWCIANQIDFVAVGPEDPLDQGIVDVLEKKNVACFGPTRAGAQIEANKEWSKTFMWTHGIPTARGSSFDDAEQAKAFIRESPYPAWVVKASGLAAGKGVIVASSTEGAVEAVDEIMGKFGSAGDVVVVEELLQGEEVSLLAFVDGTTVRPMLPAQDHKRLGNGDCGPNTGGMGAYCPCPIISAADLEFVRKHVLEKAVDSLRLKEGITYKGVLYAGLMLTTSGPKVLEFNCRFGDPETQVILPLLQSDLYHVMSACCHQRLADVHLTWKANMNAVGVIMASAGYPETSTKGCVISGLPEQSSTKLIFHSGVAANASKHLVTNGGRVLIAVCLKPQLRQAALEATNTCKSIRFAGAQFRTDIAQKAYKFLPLSYKDSGVDIDAGEEFVQKIKPLAKTTHRPGVVGGIGGFGGVFRLKELPYTDPFLCEATRGVGSKIKLAMKCGSYQTIGNDLFAMCANDLLEYGAEPICFLDYIACGKLEVSVATMLVKGIAESCLRTNCALLGGETAEMPSLYAPGTYDVAGYCVGVAEEQQLLPQGGPIGHGDLVLGLPASGLHCDGFEVLYPLLMKSTVDLAQRIGPHTDRTVGQDLLQPSKIYVNDLLPFIRRGLVKAVVHVTDGFMMSAHRIMPQTGGIELDFETVKLPEIYGWLTSVLGLCDADLLESFNCGFGMLVVIDANCEEAKQIPNAVVLGQVQTGDYPDSVVVRNLQTALESVAMLFPRMRETQVGLTRESKFVIKEKLAKMLQLADGRADVLHTRGGKRVTRVPPQYKDPVIVVGTDGVGTKIKIAQIMNKNSTVGIDLVAMCANDILCNGAVPLSFLSYYACGQLRDDIATDITAGVIEGATQACSNLIDAHCSEIPLVYDSITYDLAGFALGVTDYNTMLPRVDDIVEGDVVIALPSSGVHSNGFSLIHKIMERVGATFEDKAPFSDKSFGEEFLTPTQIYVKTFLKLMVNNYVKAIAHITGGGLIENIPRVLDQHKAVKLDANRFNILPVFAWLADAGKVSSYEMLRTYNCGIGAVLIVSAELATTVMNYLHFRYGATMIGSVINRKTANTPQVVVKDFDKCIARVQRVIKSPKKRVAVLISGTGTNMEVLVQASRDNAFGMGAEIVLVVSNRPEVKGLERAAKAGIKSQVLAHRDYPVREEYDAKLAQLIDENDIDLICLAGFMRVLSESFVKKWKGRLINIHPSLLPKHPGLHVQQRALDAKDSHSGCTVHFVDEGVDTGAIIIQEVVPIMPGDTVETLTARIQKAEHYAYPVALRMLATGAVSMSKAGTTVYH